MWDIVVARFKDGSIMKGSSKEFSVRKREFHLELTSGEIKRVVVEDLKALFFVRTLEGNRQRAEIYSDILPEKGRRVIVEFHDGEVIIGYTQIYAPDLQGFFLLPADIKSNNKRIYVICSATKTVTFVDQRSNNDRRQSENPDFEGPERRSGGDRRALKDRRKLTNAG